MPTLNLCKKPNSVNGSKGDEMAKESNTEKKVEAVLLPILEKNKFELVDIEFVKEGPNWYLRIFIDKDGGITIDDCELVSKALALKLDEADPIEQAYVLEISSPGLDRPLKKPEDFIKYAGEIVDIKLYKPLEGKKEYQGKLQGLEDNIVTIFDEENKIQFNRKEIASIRLAVIF